MVEHQKHSISVASDNNPIMIVP